MEMPTPAGPVYLSASITNGVKARYEDWLEGRARRRVFELKDQMGPEEFHESMRSVTESSGAGVFSWGGAAFITSLKQMPGIVKMVVLLANTKKVRQAHPEQTITEDHVLGMMSDPAMTVVFKEAIGGVIQGSPNFLTPPTRTGAED